MSTRDQWISLQSNHDGSYGHEASGRAVGIDLSSSADGGGGNCGRRLVSFAHSIERLRRCRLTLLRTGGRGSRSL